MRLTDREQQALARLEEHERPVRRGAMVRRERDNSTELFVLRSGWLFSSILLDDGSRQIVRLHLPGDVIGLSAAAFGESPEAVVALTDARVHPFDRGLLRDLFEDHPRLAAIVLMLAKLDYVAVVDRLASIGRTPARARVASLILETAVRLRITKPDLGRGFDLPLTQEEIGDATGLTAVHVNRMMRTLVEDGVIARSGSRVEILDEQRLARIAKHVDRYSRLDTGWLPAAR